MRTELGKKDSARTRRAAHALLAALLLGSSMAAAQAASPILSGPSILRAGDRATLELRVEVGPELPVRVTPRAEGAALEVVRGSLLRPDAVDPEANPLVFRIPVVAREPGPARVHVRVQSFECAGEVCVPSTRETARELRVDR